MMSTVMPTTLCILVRCNLHIPVVFVLPEILLQGTRCVQEQALNISLVWEGYTSNTLTTHRNGLKTCCLANLDEL